MLKYFCLKKINVWGASNNLAMQYVQGENVFA